MVANARLRTAVVAVAAFGALLSLAAPADAAPPKRTPVPTVSVSPVSPTNQTSATWTFSDSDSRATFACSFDASAYAACTSPVKKTGLKAGNHSLTVRATVAGWRSSSASRSLLVDLTAPAAPTIDAMPTAPTRSAITPTFTDAATDLKGYVCSVDGAAAAPCISGAPLDAAADGLRTLTVKAVDNAGNQSAAATATWIRDTFVAAPIVTSAPSTPTVDGGATFLYASLETDAAFQCSLDTGAFVSCPSTGVHYSSLGIGTHSFVVRAVDTAGNTATSSAFTWTIEAVQPNLVAASWSSPASLPAGVSNQSSASLAFTTTNATAVTCTVDGVGPAPCTSPLTLSSLVDGQHLAVVQADGTGGPVMLAYSWFVDTTPPGAPTVYGPKSRTNSTSVAAWVVPAQLDDVVTCTLDAAPATCSLSGQLTASGLAEGLHTIVATATDKAGNSSQASASWTIDTVVPTYTVTKPTTTSGSAVVTFNEDVTAASASPVLALATGGAIATTRTCATAAGAATSCTSTAVRSVAVRAATALVPGQYYALTVNGAGPAPVTDVAGNPAATTTTSFRAPLVVQENDPATTQAWRRVSSSLAKGGSYVMQNIAGARASWTFTGTAISTYLTTGPANGIAYVYIDGRYRGSWNTYAAKAGLTSKLVYGLTSRSHTITILVTGKRGSSLGKGVGVGVDGFVVGRTLTATPALRTTWRRASFTGSSAGAQAFSSLASTSFGTSFRGTAVTWSHATSPSMGIAYVYVDGVKKATVDLWSASARAGVKWRLTGLTDAQHKILIVTSGLKRAASKGTLVAVDYISTV